MYLILLKFHIDLDLSAVSTDKGCRTRNASLYIGYDYFLILLFVPINILINFIFYFDLQQTKNDSICQLIKLILSAIQ